jgi:hypothetical protein
MGLSTENMLEALAALIILILVVMFPWVMIDVIKHRRQRKADKREDYADYVERTRAQYQSVPPTKPVTLTSVPPLIHMMVLALHDDEDDDEDTPVERSGRNDIRLTSEYINMYLNILDYGERLYKEK